MSKGAATADNRHHERQGPGGARDETRSTAGVATLRPSTPLGRPDTNAENVLGVLCDLLLGPSAAVSVGISRVARGRSPSVAPGSHEAGHGWSGGTPTPPWRGVGGVRVRAGRGVGRRDHGEAEACLGPSAGTDSFPAVNGKVTFPGRSDFLNRTGAQKTRGSVCSLTGGRGRASSPPRGLPSGCRARFKRRRGGHSGQHSRDRGKAGTEMSAKGRPRPRG